MKINRVIFFFFSFSCTVEKDGAIDVNIYGKKNRNRAVNGDQVAVQLLPIEQWKVWHHHLSQTSIKLTTNFNLMSHQRALTIALTT